VSESRVSDSTSGTIVNSAPSSGGWVGFPPSAASARGSRTGVALPPASPLSRVCPGQRGGSPSGDLSAPPALSLRGWGLDVLIRPPSAGTMQEGDLPPLVIPVADEGGFTSVVMVSSKLFPSIFLSTDVAGVLFGTRLCQAGTLIPCSQPTLDRLGVCPENSPEMQRGRCPAH